MECAIVSERIVLTESELYAQAAKSWGINDRPQFSAPGLVLETVRAINAEQRIATLKEIAKKASLDPSTASKAAQVLIGRGEITRPPGTRGQFVAVTKGETK